MKLRLRSVETKETIKLETPNPCSLEQLRELVSQKLLPQVSSTIHFSLNRKDALTTTSDESIQSIGITSGDLIYFTTAINGFSNPPLVPSPAQSSSQTVIPNSSKHDEIPIPDSSKQDETLIPDSSKQDETLIPNSSKQDETLIPNSSKQDETLIPNSSKEDETEIASSSKRDDTQSSSIDKGKTVDVSDSVTDEVEDSMEVDSVIEVGKSFSVPGFLRKVFDLKLSDNDDDGHKLLGIAVHAVLLESGFVEIDPVSKSLTGNNFNVKGNWHITSFHYTISDIDTSDKIPIVKIKFQNFGKYCKVYGSLVSGTGVNSVLLDEHRLVPFLNVVWANCGQVVATVDENNRVFDVQPEKEVFEFWRKIKDELALPLLIDVCETAGLGLLPPCFMRLPTELKLKILESVSGVDVAKVSCVCSELRYLGSSDDLWKQKYSEEFGNGGGTESGRTFKERFARKWESRKRRKIAGGSGLSVTRRRIPGGYGIGHWQYPRIIGGDYDAYPYPGPFGLPSRGGPRLSPNCNLGGLGSGLDL